MKFNIHILAVLWQAITAVSEELIVGLENNVLERRQCFQKNYCINGKDLTTCDQCCSGQCTPYVFGCGVAPGQFYGQGCTDGGGPPPSCFPENYCINGKDLTSCNQCCSGQCQPYVPGCGVAPGQPFGQGCAGSGGGGGGFPPPPVCFPEDHCINGKDLTSCDQCCSRQCKPYVFGCGVAPGQTYGQGCAGTGGGGGGVFPPPPPTQCLEPGHCISGKDLTYCYQCCSKQCVSNVEGCGSAPGFTAGAACA